MESSPTPPRKITRYKFWTKMTTESPFPAPKRIDSGCQKGFQSTQSFRFVKKKTHLIELCDAALVSLGNGHQISRFPTILRVSE